MDPATISAGVQVFSAVRGIFGSSRKRREARAKQRKFKSLLGQQYDALQRARVAEAQEFQQLRQFQGEGFDLRQDRQINQFNIQRDRAMSQAGRTGFAGSGSAMQAVGSLDDAFALQQQGLGLERRSSAFDLQMREAASIRDLQATAFQMDAMAAEQNIGTSYGKSLLDMYGGI